MREISEILKKITRIIEDPKFISEHKREAKNFTRKVKLSFDDIVKFVLGKTGNNFSMERYNFCNKLDKDVTTSAICQARDKVKHTAFVSLLQNTSRMIEPTNLYKGYRLIAYDGMTGELPRTAELMEKYRPSKSAEYPMFHAVAEYDVLNCCYTNALFEPAPANERELACQLIDNCNYGGKEIFLLDRGFPSVKVIQSLENKGKKYIIRVSSSFLKEVNEFTKSKAIDKEITVNYEKRRKATSRTSFEGAEYEFKIRCVKIPLSSKKTEILVTNLTKDEMSKSEIGDLYNLRWRIETAFVDLKYAVHVEEFIGKKEEFIKQEFYASLIQANLSMMLVEISNTVIKNIKKKKNWTIR